MFIGQRLYFKKCILILMWFLAAIFPAHQAYAAGPAKIKWIKTCGPSTSGDWDHARWVIGLSNGVKLGGWYNPAQNRTATYALILSAHASGQNVYWENTPATTAVVCGVTTNFVLDPNYGNTTTFMVGDP